MAKKPKIKVLVVEDSSVVRTLLVHLLNSDSQLEVIGTANNGREALEFLAEQSPDVVLMDIDMPEMGGFEATRRIMESRPLPIVICSGSTNPRETITAFRVMEVGALAFVDKPFGKEHVNFEATATQLLQTVKLMSEVKVVRRWSRDSFSDSPRPSPAPPSRSSAQIRAIGIGASTGGPPVLQTILAALPKNFSVPILIVQHISPGFLDGMVDWLHQTTGLKIQVGAHNAQPMPGHVYLAPDDCHLTVKADGRLALSKDEAENGLRPSVSRLFRSLAEVCGANAVGILLTGMGRDGARELKQMKDAGAITIAQNQESCVVYGMPGEAVAIDGATFVLPPEKIAAAIVTQVNGRNPRGPEGR